MSANTPVGTTLALLERSLKVMSAVQSRVHWALKNELRIIFRIVREDMPPNYEFDVGGQFDRTKDFQGPVDVVPVSDANASTMAQRVVKMQAAMSLAQSAPPGMYDMKALHRQAMEALDIANIDKIIPADEEIPAMDPVSENAALLTQKPVQAYYYQDHESHIQVHMAAINDPKIQSIVGMSPSAPAIMAAMDSHILEHVAFGYRKQVEQALGSQLPDPSTPIPPEADRGLSLAVAKAAQHVQQANSVEMSQKKALEQAKDPVLQIQMADLAIKKQGSDLDKAKFEWSKLKDADNSAIERAKLSQDAAKTAISTVGQLVGQKEIAEEASANKVLDRATQVDVARIQAEAQKSNRRANNGDN